MYDSTMPMQEHQLPQFTLRENDLPDLANWEVGQDYYIVMRVEMIAKRNRKDLTSKVDQVKIEGDFEMHSIKPLGNKPVDATELERQDFEKVKAEALAGQ